MPFFKEPYALIFVCGKILLLKIREKESVFTWNKRNLSLFYWVVT